MNVRLLVLTLVLASVQTSFATTPDAPAGQNTLKLAPLENPVRSARKELAVVEQDIKKLERQILDSESQATLAKSAQGSNSMQAASFTALANGYKTQRDQLVAKRGELQAELNASR